MPKIVDHAQRREQVALVACGVVAAYGFERATVVRIARAAGYSTGMLAHYFDSKQDIILAALRLIMHRIELRLTRAERGTVPRGPAGDAANLLGVLSEALPIDAQRRTECAFWLAFWGQVSSDRRLRRINTWVHGEYLRLYRRCFEQHWPGWRGWPAARRDETLRAVVIGINGLTASAVSSPGDWPAARQLAQLDLLLTLLRAHRGGSRQARSSSGS